MRRSFRTERARDGHHVIACRSSARRHRQGPKAARTRGRSEAQRLARCRAQMQHRCRDGRILGDWAIFRGNGDDGLVGHPRRRWRARVGTCSDHPEGHGRGLARDRTGTVLRPYRGQRRQCAAAAAVGQDTKRHELLIFFSALGGLMFSGRWASYWAPSLAALFVTAWEMFGTAFRTSLAEPGSAAARPDYRPPP